MAYNIVSKTKCDKYNITILENSEEINELLMANIIENIIHDFKFTDYEILDKDIIEVIIQNCKNRSEDVGYELNNGSEFEVLTNQYLVDILDHLKLTTNDLFKADTGIDVLTFDKTDNTLNLTEVKSSTNKDGNNSDIFVKKVRESLDSQLCKKRKTGTQAISTITVVKKTLEQSEANIIMSLLKKINKDRANLNGSILLNKDSITLNSFIWCSCVEQIDISAIENFLTKKESNCNFCGKVSCDSSHILFNKSVDYNIYVNRITEKFDMKLYLNILADNLKVRYEL